MSDRDRNFRQSMLEFVRAHEGCTALDVIRGVSMYPEHSIWDHAIALEEAGEICAVKESVNSPWKFYTWQFASSRSLIMNRPARHPRWRYFTVTVSYNLHYLRDLLASHSSWDVVSTDVSSGYCIALCRVSYQDEAALQDVDAFFKTPRQDKQEVQHG